jgi:hypothetical protein
MEKNPIFAAWREKPWVIATMHGKDRVIAPLLRDALGVHTILPTQLNTDRFGTFTREIPRTGSQLDAARAKARAAIQETRSNVAIASEGSFAQHPHLPFVQSNLELVLLVDTIRNIEIIGTHRSSTVQARGKTVSTLAEARACADEWGFPNQGIVVRVSPTSNRHIYKEITTHDDLERIVTKLLSSWFRKTIYLETDMRAHRCPARMESIRLATLNLIENCMRTCPQCHSPGFSIVRATPGLPCNQCGTHTDSIASHTYRCPACTFEETRPVALKAADPSTCPHCNP